MLSLRSFATGRNLGIKEINEVGIDSEAIALSRQTESHQFELVIFISAADDDHASLIPLYEIDEEPYETLISCTVLD